VSVWSQPYKPSKKAPFVAFMLLVVMVVAVTIVSATQARFSWMWVFPFLATAATVYGYRRERVAKTMAQGGLWVLVQIVTALGALALIALPAKY
jgi:hypothetical protein